MDSDEARKQRMKKFMEKQQLGKGLLTNNNTYPQHINNENINQNKEKFFNTNLSNDVKANLEYKSSDVLRESSDNGKF